MQHPYKENGRPEEKRGGPHYGPADFGDLDDLINGAVRIGSEVGGSVLGSISDALRDAADTVQNAVRAGLQPPDEFTAYRRRLERKLKSSQDGFLWGMGFCGCFFAGCFAVAAVVMAALWGVGPGPLGMTADEFQVFPILTLCFTPIAVGFGVMGGIGCRKGNYFGRLRRYLRAARGWTEPVADLARNTAKSREKALHDLQNAVAAGHLPDACLDPAGSTLYLDASLYRPDPAPAAGQPAEPAGERTDAEIFREKGVDFLDYLGRCRGRLGEQADAELETMRRTCAAIIGFIHNHPDQLPRVRRFADYYLPTTRKLLDTALGLGDTDTEGAETIRRDINGILHTLNTAYGRLYDTLLQDVSMDVSAEIDTLEAMLSQDGLTHGFRSDFGVR